jgi:uncharacterized protein (TIGR02466 family)
VADEAFGLFPTPFLRVPKALDDALVRGLVEHFAAAAVEPNKASGELSHTAMLRPEDSPLLVQVAERVLPKIEDMGALMFGERLAWTLKEMWVNVLETGGSQSMHHHANSFVPGVVYLTPTHADAQTVFLRSAGTGEFVFRNVHARTTATPFTADRWIGPVPAPGDLVLFPSHLLHAVPANPGGRRITLAFNAIPERLDSWGYAIRFSG